MLRNSGKRACNFAKLSSCSPRADLLHPYLPVTDICGRGGIGRRAALRALWGKTRGSSNLLDRTKSDLPPFHPLLLPRRAPTDRITDQSLAGVRTRCTANQGRVSGCAGVESCLHLKPRPAWPTCCCGCRYLRRHDYPRQGGAVERTALPTGACLRQDERTVHCD